LDIQRTELKYILPLSKYKSFRAAITPFVKFDRHIKEGRRTYEVHSVYYDTLGLKYYQDKIDGEDVREKFRIRFYNDGGDPSLKKVWFEIKCKKGSYIKKIRKEAFENEVNDLLSFKKDNGMTHILNQVFMKNLMPVTKVSYLREALICPYERDTRITIDNEITGAFVQKYCGNKVQNQKYILSPLYSILELKITDSIPTWLSHTIETFDLQLTPFSKYAKAIECCSIMRRLTGENYEF